jgi:hypothetical protein
MSLLTKGINRLSQLQIDTDKDWQAKEISNLKAIAGEMAHGDVAFRGAEVIKKLEADAGKGFNFLRSRGPGLSPVWDDIESLIQYMTGAANRAVALELPFPLSVLTLSYVAMATGGQQFQPSLPTPTPSLDGQVSAAVANAVDGAVSHNEDVGDTDETVQANSPDTNDMTLLPPDGSINDHYALGQAEQYDAICVLVGTAGSDYSLTYEYSKGGGLWGLLTVFHDSMGEWKNTGKGWLTFKRPLDWAADTVGGIPGLYWIRARANSVGAGFVQPVGTQAWILAY